MHVVHDGEQTYSEIDNDLCEDLKQSGDGSVIDPDWKIYEQFANGSISIAADSINQNAQARAK